MSDFLTIEFVGGPHCGDRRLISRSQLDMYGCYTIRRLEPALVSLLSIAEEANAFAPTPRILEGRYRLRMDSGAVPRASLLGRAGHE